MRADLAGEPGLVGCGVDRRPGLLPREPAPAVAEEQRTAPHGLDVMLLDERPARAVEPRVEMVDRHLADRHEPLLVALADHPHERAVEREVLAVEPDRLADP